MLYNWKTCTLAGPMVPGFEDREIPESLSCPPIPPETSFCFPLVDTWRDRIWRMLDDVITDRVRSEFMCNPPEYVVSDDLSWLDDIICDTTCTVVNIKAVVARRLSDEYRAFRAAPCRPHQ